MTDTDPAMPTVPPASTSGRPQLSHLAVLEAEAIFIMREVASGFERPALLFSGGKDSIVLTHLARKAFWPGPVPFALLHVDTGHNFPETLEFRDRWVAQIQAPLIVRLVEDSIRRGRVVEDTGPGASRNALQTVTLLDAIKEHDFQVAIGGARRDEEKARAKERFFSLRNADGQWEPRQQRPELWALYNTFTQRGEHMRVFPLSNWTELDVWQYLAQEDIPLPSIYFAHERECVNRNGALLAHAPCVGLLPGERPERLRVRFRTIGDMTCTGAVCSDAGSIADIIREITSSRISERGTRMDDQRSAAAMEDRKREGYF